MLNLALPKGRLGDKVTALLRDAGYDCPVICSGDRRLTVDDEKNGVRYIWVKPSDVAIYVERGAADAGVVGKDVILEQSPDVYELCDLGIGRCRMAVAAPADFYDDVSRDEISPYRARILRRTRPRNRYHQAVGFDRDCARDRNVGRHRRYRRDGSDAQGK